MTKLTEANIYVSSTGQGISVYMRVLPEDRGRGVCEASATHLDGGEWWVNRVFIPEHRRREGIGGQLLERLKQEVKKREGFKFLTVNPGGYGSDLSDLHRFYGRHGFIADANLCFRWTGLAVGIVPAEEILNRPGLNLRARDYLDEGISIRGADDGSKDSKG